MKNEENAFQEIITGLDAHHSQLSHYFDVNHEMPSNFLSEATEASVAHLSSVYF